MDNNQNGGVDRLTWPFRPVAQLIAIESCNSEPGTNFFLLLMALATVLIGTQHGNLFCYTKATSSL
jgi:hypothetical protein